MKLKTFGARLAALTRRFTNDKRGNFGIFFAIASVPMLAGAAVAIEYGNGSRVRSDLQQRLDAAVLAGAREDSDQIKHAEHFFLASYENSAVVTDAAELAATMVRFELSDGELNGWATRTGESVSMFSIKAITEKQDIAVFSQAKFKTPGTRAACITVLSNTSQALLINSGANVAGTGCEIHVHSKQQPAMIMNAGATIDVAKTCVAGGNIIHNGGKLGGLEKNCPVPVDPYEGKIPEPVMPSAFTQGAIKVGSNYTIKPGKHRGFNINETSTITFEPGLHIITETIILPPNARVMAEGVTFYFANVNAELRSNGSGLTFIASAPKSGEYKDILMFEKKGNNKGPFIFNGSVGEHLEGAIYLPNRNATYNSNTNIEANMVSMVFNTLIINQSYWNLDGMPGGGSGSKTVYLSR
jgi:Flp pilus assembly protein TadG